MIKFLISFDNISFEQEFENLIPWLGKNNNSLVHIVQCYFKVMRFQLTHYVSKDVISNW